MASIRGRAFKVNAVIQASWLNFLAFYVCLEVLGRPKSESEACTSSDQACSSVRAVVHVFC